jgi:N-acetyl-anhydromuramyl-L-alanine amidase AmpD
MLNISKIIQRNLPESNYFKVACDKKIICVHHTAGNSNPLAVVDDWKNRTDHVATAFIIGGKPKAGDKTFVDGDIVQAFSSKYYAYHLGLKTNMNVPIAKSSIGIELCNFGWLTKKADGKYYTYVNSVVPAEEVIELDKEYRGYKYWHKYTDGQLLSLRDLLIYLCDKYNIPKKYQGDEIFDLNQRALNGESGIWSHTSFRSDKFDISPQPSIKRILSTLEASSV